MTKGASQPALWFLVTWHADATRLLRLTPLLRVDGGKCVISIGGPGNSPELPSVSSLLLLDDIQLLYRPPVTWGGQKLLFHNVLEVAESFVRNAPEGSWLQVICNRSFPLIGPREMRDKLAAGMFEHHPSPHHASAVPVWHGEWSDDIVADLPTIYESALNEVFASADLSEIERLTDAPGPYQTVPRLQNFFFNFSPRAQSMQTGGGGDAQHSYNISAFSTDARWMSFARLGEFVDTSAENGCTFSRRPHPIQNKWAHGVISKYNLHSGDPFVTLTTRYADVVLNDPRCHELFAAMNPAFCPEMNLFDTVVKSEQFGMRYELGHAYFRRPNQTATDQDIADAEAAAAEHNLFFMRKTMPVGSAAFVDHFSRRVEREWVGKPMHHAASRAVPSKPPAIPTPADVLACLEDGCAVRMRDLRGTLLGVYYFSRDGHLNDAQGQPQIPWQIHTSGGLELHFDWGTKVYERISAQGGNLVLAPSEIVSQGNGWGVFVEIDLAGSRPGFTGEIVAFDAAQYLDEREWRSSYSPAAALMACYEPADDPHYPGRYDRKIKHLKGESGIRLMAGAEERACRVSTFTVANGVEALLLSETEAPGPMPSVRLTAQDVAGPVTISLLEGDRNYTLDERGRILSTEGELVGAWRSEAGALWFFGVEGLRIAYGTQFSWNEGRWRVSGWGWKNFKDVVSFAAVLPRAI